MVGMALHRAMLKYMGEVHKAGNSCQVASLFEDLLQFSWPVQFTCIEDFQMETRMLAISVFGHAVCF